MFHVWVSYDAPHESLTHLTNEFLASFDFSLRLFLFSSEVEALG